MGWEFDLLNGIQKVFQSDMMDMIMPVITAFGNGGILWIALGLIFTLQKDTRKLGICMLAAIVLEVVCCNVILKPLVARPRPFSLEPGRILLIPAPEDYSFPSGHTAVSFAAASAAWFMKKKKLGLVFGIAAMLIAFSRLYLFVHYPTDVFAGAFIGSLCGAAAAELLKRAEEKKEKAWRKSQECH